MIKSVAHEKLIHVYNAASLLLLTSFHEGSNNTLKEALACNLPIVSRNAGDAKERLSGVFNCRVIDSLLPVDFVNDSISILQNGERSNGTQFITKLSIGVTAGNIFSVYKMAKNGLN